MGKRVFFGYICGWALATALSYLLREAGFADAAYDRIAAKVVEQMSTVVKT